MPTRRRGPLQQESDEEDGDVDGEPPEAATSEGARSSRARRKWWHVADEEIDQLVTGIRDGHTPVPSVGSRHSTAAQTLAKPASTSAKRTQQRVRFGGEVREDALDKMLRHTRENFQEGSASPSSFLPGTKSWQVPDYKIQEMILQMSSESPAQGGDGGALGTAGGALVQGQRKAQDWINIWIVFVDSEDSMRIRVPPELRIGPQKPPPGNRFTDIFGQGASTKGFEMKRSFDYRHRQFGNTARENWTPKWKTSLKGMIEELADIEVSRQRLKYRDCPLSNDEVTLRTFGIKDGDVIHLAIQKWTPGGHSKRNVVLACSRKLEQKDSNEESEGPAKYDGYTLRSNRNLQSCRKATGDVYMQPKWVSQANPRLFARVGIAVDGLGDHRVKPNNADSSIYLSDVGDAKLQRVRETVVAGRA